MRDPILGLALVILTCVGFNRLVAAVTKHRQPPRFEVARDPPPPQEESAYPFACVASSVSGAVELEITTPGCFGSQREGLSFDWKGDQASMRALFADAATRLPRAALVGFLFKVEERALGWRENWTSCRHPWGHLAVEARWTCVHAGGNRIQGYSTTDYPLCTPSDRRGRARDEPVGGEIVQRLMRSFRDRWQAGPPRHLPVAATGGSG